MRKFRRVLLAAAMLLSLNSLHAQEYPIKPIKMVVPYAAGGSTDVWARLIAEKLREKWGQTVIVENRGGANGNVGAEYVARSAPDGYTLLVTAPGPLVINESLFPKLGFEPDSFAPVSLVVRAPNVLIVHSKLSIENVRQLIAQAKANPDKLNYASQGSGSTSHLAAESFKLLSGTKITHIPYKGSAPALTDLLGGQVQMMFAEISTALPHVRSGRVRALAVGSEKRNPLLPDVPAMFEFLPEFYSATWTGVVAPPKTPPTITAMLSAAITEALKQPDSVNRAQEMSAEIVAGTPAEMTQFMKQERARWGKVIRTTGITVD